MRRIADHTAPEIMDIQIPAMKVRIGRFMTLDCTLFKHGIPRSEVIGECDVLISESIVRTKRINATFMAACSGGSALNVTYYPCQCLRNAPGVIPSLFLNRSIKCPTRSIPTRAEISATGRSVERSSVFDWWILVMTRYSCGVEPV